MSADGGARERAGGAGAGARGRVTRRRRRVARPACGQGASPRGQRGARPAPPVRWTRRAARRPTAAKARPRRANRATFRQPLAAATFALRGHNLLGFGWLSRLLSCLAALARATEAGLRPRARRRWAARTQVRRGAWRTRCPFPPPRCAGVVHDPSSVYISKAALARVLAPAQRLGRTSPRPLERTSCARPGAGCYASPQKTVGNGSRGFGARTGPGAAGHRAPPTPGAQSEGDGHPRAEQADRCVARWRACAPSAAVARRVAGRSTRDARAARVPAQRARRARRASPHRNARRRAAQRTMRPAR